MYSALSSSFALSHKRSSLREGSFQTYFALWIAEKIICHEREVECDIEDKRFSEHYSKENQEEWRAGLTKDAIWRSCRQRKGRILPSTEYRMLVNVEASGRKG